MKLNGVVWSFRGFHGTLLGLSSSLLHPVTASVGSSHFVLPFNPSGKKHQNPLKSRENPMRIPWKSHEAHENSMKILSKSHENPAHPPFPPAATCPSGAPWLAPWDPAVAVDLAGKGVENWGPGYLVGGPHPLMGLSFPNYGQTTISDSNLVGGWGYLPEKYELVSWDDKISNNVEK